MARSQTVWSSFHGNGAHLKHGTLPRPAHWQTHTFTSCVCLLSQRSSRTGSFLKGDLIREPRRLHFSATCPCDTWCSQLYCSGIPVWTSDLVMNTASWLRSDILSLPADVCCSSKHFNAHESFLDAYKNWTYSHSNFCFYCSLSWPLGSLHSKAQTRHIQFFNLPAKSHLGKKVDEVSGEDSEATYLFQSCSALVQHFKSVLLQCTVWTVARPMQLLTQETWIGGPPSAKRSARFWVDIIWYKP